MKIHQVADAVRYSSMTTAQIREAFLIDALHQPGSLNLAYVDLDRAVVGIAAPLDTNLALEADETLRAKYFLERRELGALNIGGRGIIRVDGSEYVLDNLDCLYLGRGVENVSFESADTSSPAIFYLLSYSAHSSYPTTLIRRNEANPIELGSAETCNRRTVCKYIHLDGARSCQLVMGVTHLHPGSAWNTMPAHTHAPFGDLHVFQSW